MHQNNRKKIVPKVFSDHSVNMFQEVTALLNQLEQDYHDHDYQVYRIFLSFTKAYQPFMVHHKNKKVFIQQCIGKDGCIGRVN